MKKDYWDVKDEQVIDKTGKKIEDWMVILETFNSVGKKSNEVVAYLQEEFGVPRYWARTLVTHFMKSKEA
jgi:hypothetical protein